MHRADETPQTPQTPGWPRFAAGLLLGVCIGVGIGFAIARRGDGGAPASAATQASAQSAAPSAAKPLAAVPPDLPVRGDAAAPITIEAFLDLESPASLRVAPVLVRILDDYPRDVRIALRLVAEPGHVNAPGAHRALLAAGRQGKLWELFDRLVASGHLERAALVEQADALGLDARAFEASLADPALDAALERDRSEAAARGVGSTPTFFVNGRPLSGPQPYENFVAVLERERARVAR
jgi:protein-disulfide isomerase